MGIFKAWDPEKVVVEHLHVDVLPETATTWDVSNIGHTLREIRELSEADILGHEVVYG